ncbi:hypothetical protein ACFOWZ_44255 [Lentzea rhizosphaerae]|uniref:Uncharacterized protein n=1 Tax=Lentzea rhizosphaerae TaxID=2041025 RepID=A0ABV8C9T0_9PSEU
MAPEPSGGVVAVSPGIRAVGWEGAERRGGGGDAVVVAVGRERGGGGREMVAAR